MATRLRSGKPGPERPSKRDKDQADLPVEGRGDTGFSEDPGGVDLEMAATLGADMAEAVEGERAGASADGGPVRGGFGNRFIADAYWQPGAGFRAFMNPRRITGAAPLFPLAVLFGLNAVDEFDRVAFNVLLPEIRDHFDLNLQGVLTLSAVLVPIGLIAELPIGYFADRRNRVRMATIAAAGWAIFSVMTGVAGIVTSLALIYIARAGSVIAKTLNATHNSLLADYYPVESRARVFYAHRFANSVGQITGPVIAAWLAITFGWQSPFLILALPTVFMIFMALRLKEPTRGVYERLAAGADAETANTEEQPATFSEAFRVLFNNRSARRIYYSLPFISASAIGLGQILNLFYDEVYRIDALGRSFIAVGSEAIQIVALIVGAVLVQRIMARDPGLVMKLLGATAVVAAGAITIIAASPWIGGLPVAILGQVLYAGVSAMLTPGIYAVISLSVPPRMRTLGFATGSVWFLLGVPILPIVGGVGDRFGLSIGLMIFLPVYLLGSFLIASSGNFLNADIKKVQDSSLAQSEARRRRLDGDPQVLIVRGLDVSYDQTQVLFKVDFEVADGEIVALLGTNGAGKSTLLKAISGINLPDAGAIIFDGRDITASDPVRTAVQGISQVPGGRGVFPSLTVAENLRAAGWMFRKDQAYLRDATKRVLEHFPILERRWDTPAGSLSGGEQQMLSLSQAFISRPKLLMIDELSLGLAPTVVEKLLEIVRAIHDQGTTIILVEQSVNVALKLAKRAVFMEKGEIRFSGPTHELLERTDILRAVFLKGAGAHTDALDDSEVKALAKVSKAEVAALAEADRRRRNALLDQPVVLETVGLTKRYGGVSAVNSVDLELRQGQILGLIGPNGAGKTTIFDLISGFIPTNGGRIHLLGQEITEWPSHKRAAFGLGRSFQDARLYTSLTVREAIAASMQTQVEMTNPAAAMFGLPIVKDSEDHVTARTQELMDLMGLNAFRDKFIGELSTGSRRMVEIATLLCNDPKVIVLDEPSSGIAQRETEALGPVLREVQKYTSCSMLIIEHDMPLLSGLVDHVYALEQGAVIAFGTPDEVLNHPRVIESYLGASSYAEIDADIEDDDGPAPQLPAGRRPAARRAPARKAAAKRAPAKKRVPAKAGAKRVPAKKVAKAGTTRKAAARKAGAGTSR